MTERLINVEKDGKMWVTDNDFTRENGIVVAIMKKLREYETAEEEGRLVILPCKIGQCVYTNHSMVGWYMRKTERPYLGRVVFIGLNAEESFFNIVLGEGKMLQYKFSDIGKTVFLTREEAEKALKEMTK